MLSRPHAHSTRHAVGRHIMAKTGNVAAVQRQLGPKNAVEVTRATLAGRLMQQNQNRCRLK